MNLHEKYIKTLSIFHYVHSGLSILGIILYGIFMMFVLGGASMITINAFHNYTFLTSTILSMLGWTAALFLGIGFLACIALSIALYLTGRFMAQRTHYMFCLSVAGIESILFPIGTILGILTLITLTRHPVQELFGVQESKNM